MLDTHERFVLPTGPQVSERGTSLDASQASAAWSKLMRALGIEGPRAITRSKAARKRLARLVR